MCQRRPRRSLYGPTAAGDGACGGDTGVQIILGDPAHEMQQITESNEW